MCIRDRISGIVADSFLEKYDEFNIGAAFRKAAQASIAYTLSVRCTEEAENQFEPENFRDATVFNTRQTAAALGNAVSSISREVFHEIERAIRDYERTKAQERSQDLSLIHICLLRCHIYEILLVGTYKRLTILLMRSIW